MCFLHSSTANAIMALRHEGMRCQVDSHQVHSRAVPDPWAWLSRRGRRLLGWAGHRLVVLGQWLQRRSLPQPSL